jgi:excinuclease UvrABC nuclease subunit
LGPIGSPRQASLAARALASCTDEELDGLLQGGPLPRLRERLTHLAESQRYEEAARLRDRIEALENVVDRLRRLGRLRALELCLIAPAVEPGWQKAFFVSGGAVRAVRSLPPSPGARLEIDAGIALCQSADELEEALTAGQAEDLMLLHGFIRRPPPELAVLPLDAGTIADHLSGRRLPRAA